MILHRDGSVRRMGAEAKPASVPDLARVLRQARTARGLQLGAVSQQTGIPLDQLQDLESGTVDRLPDRVAVLKALSRYAAFLNLPGDQFVMTLVEHWPSAATGASPMVVQGGPTNGNRAPDTAVGTLAPPLSPATVDDLSKRAVPLSVPTSTARPTSVGLPVFEGRHNSTAQVPMVMADTGVTPAVGRAPVDRLGMVVVRALVVVATLLLVVGTAWLVVNRVHPQWLADLHIPYTSKGAVSAPPAVTKPTTATKPSTPAARAKPSLQLVSANGNQATFAINASLFAVRVSASGGATWVSVSGPLSTTPEFAGILQSGQSRLVAANHQLTVQIGSTAARLAVQVNNHVIGTYVPPGAPFTMTFTTK
ncbi:MAG TPA: helix-turn-helix transcriptional regulator [Acidimicrobiales bacterium]|nr:helix-turn-helix transcriptional regulator [Acidimicrobiales bacterium]